jgi:hypothetical protein
VPYHLLQERPAHDIATACVNGLMKSPYGLHSLIQQQTTNTSAIARAVATEAAKAAQLEAELYYARHELNVAQAELSKLKLWLSSTATEGSRSVTQRRVDPKRPPFRKWLHILSCVGFLPLRAQQSRRVNNVRRTRHWHYERLTRHRWTTIWRPGVWQV